MRRLSTGWFLTVFAVAAAAFGPARALPVAAAEYRIDRRTIPRGFEGEAAFFERVKWPKEPTGTFQETQAPAWDLKALARYIPPEGIEFADVNHRFEGRVAREAILRSLKERRGAAFTAFAHLSHIYSIPYKQYSDLQFTKRVDGQTVVQMADWYTLTFRRAGSQPIIVRWAYTQLEGD